MRIEIQRVGDWGGMKAAFKVITEEGIEIDGFKIVEHRGELVVRVPSQKGANNRWYDRVQMPRELRDQLERDAMEAYRTAAGLPQQNPDNNDMPF